MAQWTGHHPTNTGSSPGQSAFLGCRAGLQLRARERQPISVSHSHPCFSPSISPSLPLSLKINKSQKRENTFPILYTCDHNFSSYTSIQTIHHTSLNEAGKRMQLSSIKPDSRDLQKLKIMLLFALRMFCFEKIYFLYQICYLCYHEFIIVVFKWINISKFCFNYS